MVRIPGLDALDEVARELAKAGSPRRIWQELQTFEVRSQIDTFLRTHPGLQAVIYWSAAVAVGFAAVFYAEIFNFLTHENRWLIEHRPLHMLFLGPGLTWLGWWVVKRFSPGAGGSGIPQVITAVHWEGGNVESVLDYLVGIRTVLFVILSSLFFVLAGGAIGREGSTIQIAAGLFFWMGWRFRKLWNLSYHSLLIAGGAAGIAAAFNTPLGGIVFAIEELSHAHFQRFKTHLITAVIVSGLVAQWLLGPYLFFGYPKFLPVKAAIMPWAIFVGVLTGLGGAYFGRFIYSMVCFAARLNYRQQGWLAAFVGLTLVVCGIYFGPDVLGGGMEMTSRLLFQEDKNLPWPVVIGRFIMPIFSTLAGCAGGVFAPSLAMGAAIGGKVAATIYPGQNVNLMVLLGMIGFLSGVMRTPFTAFVLVLEMTDRHSAIFPMMVTAVTANLVSNGVEPQALYERVRERLISQLTSKKADSAGDAG